jgi:hypothetical protein
LEWRRRPVATGCETLTTETVALRDTSGSGATGRDVVP